MEDRNVIVALILFAAFCTLYRSIVIAEKENGLTYTRIAHYILAFFFIGAAAYAVNYRIVDLPIPYDFIVFQLLILTVCGFLWCCAWAARKFWTYRENRIWDDDIIYDPKGKIAAKVEEDSVMSKSMKKRYNME
jgi:hypothetical protein